jgi:hypothetical protein
LHSVIVNSADDGKFVVLVVVIRRWWGKGCGRHFYSADFEVLRFAASSLLF